jgi:hypothetical protein
MANYDPKTIQHGNRMRDELKQTPASFATDSGVAKISADRPLRTTSKTRMAGPMGQRAMELMTDPAAAQATGKWMELFAQSNEGMQFNQAKMMMG